MAAQVPAVHMIGITKRFPGVVSNDHIDFAAYAGEIHALLGENGAGKSTLMNILFGIYTADEGEVLIHGQKVRPGSPFDAIRHGIGMVHQHFMLVEVQTVAENVTLGLDESHFLLNLETTKRRIAELGQRYGLQVDPDARIWQLSVGEQQRVEILKMLYRGADILILDEPTAVLTPQETRELVTVLRRIADEGHAVIFITHKLDEVMSVSDRITVLRGGRVVCTLRTCETDKESLARMMLGHPVPRVEKPEGKPGPPVLEIEGLRVYNERRLPALKGVSLRVCEGEILGVAGVAGNGQRELAEAITGLRRVTAGHIRIGNQELTNCSPRRVIERGVGHVPEDRLGTGLAANLAVSDNLIMKAYRQPAFCSGPFLNAGPIRRFVSNLLRQFGIITPSADTPVKLLSGGNLQRTVLAREMAALPEVLVAMHPTRGLDVGATQSVHKMLLEQRNRGSAILLISEDLDEVLALSDRIAVLYEGEIMGVLPADSADIDKLGLMMAGAWRCAPAQG